MLCSDLGVFFANTGTAAYALGSVRRPVVHPSPPPRPLPRPLRPAPHYLLLPTLPRPLRPDFSDTRPLPCRGPSPKIAPYAWGWARMLECFVALPGSIGNHMGCGRGRGRNATFVCKVRGHAAAAAKMLRVDCCRATLADTSPGQRPCGYHAETAWKPCGNRTETIGFLWYPWKPNSSKK